MGLRDIGESLPPGFRFYPSDEELVCHYLYKKIANEEVVRGTLVEIDLHVCEPWQLPDVAKLNSNEWYFFSFRDRKYATGFRTNRATTTGYWKATGKDRVVLDPKTRVVVGMRKTLVFYKNRAPNGIKTGWIMHEFRLENPYVSPKEDWVLCRVFHKSRGELNTHNAPSPIYNDLSHQNIPHFSHNLSHHHHGHNPNASLGLSSVETGRAPPGPGLPSHEMNDKPSSLISNHSYQNKGLDHGSTKCEDEYGFLFELDCPNSEVSRILDDMNFDCENDPTFHLKNWD